jgi:hypothetical protein
LRSIGARDHRALQDGARLPAYATCAARPSFGERDCNLTHSGISEFFYDNDIQCHLAGQSVESFLATRGAQWKPEHPELRRCFRRGGEKVVVGRKIVAA